MGLKEYEQKRNFKKTAEPVGGKGSGRELSFVVQRHHASHLHYDFRLELDGTLKSWAVPKGPSLNPADKRLAMMVEDHPIDYQLFEGTIPEGNYGAGVVMIWDKGTYESLADDSKDDIKTLRAGLKAGNLKFRLRGKKLKGEFAMVKIKSDGDGKSWLLIKHRDKYAVDEPYQSEDHVPEKIKKMGNNTAKINKQAKPKAPTEKPEEDNDADTTDVDEADYKPMLAKLESHVFDNDDWIYERKFDGYRAIGFTGPKARLISRNGINFSKTYQKITTALSAIAQNAVIDGELVIEDKNGKSRFQDLQNYEEDSENAVLKYYVFDLLALNGHDLRQLPLTKRKGLLKALTDNAESTAIFYSDQITGKATDLLQTAKKEGWEGIIGKDPQSRYLSGKRTESWLKFKLQNSQEAIICGYTAPGGSRKYFGALILGIFDEGRLKYIGNCGTGFDDASLKDLYQQFKPLQTTRKPFADKVNQHGKITWLTPDLVCEAWYSEWTDDGHLRHPVFKGLRTDKNKQTVKMETPEKQLPDEQTETFGKKTVKLTNLNKLYWKDEGITKGELISYYRDMADYILPYLKDKPLSLKRQPNGVADDGFFQKDVDTSHLPAWAKTVAVHSDSNNKEIDYLVCNDKATLLYMVNLGCIEINPWLSSSKTPENPDFVVLDLDPNDVPFDQVIETALKAKEIFDKMKLDVYIKTSGSRGMHIYCYLGARYDYDFTKMFAEYVAQLLHAELPDITSIDRSPAKRPHKIYLDFLQNRRGQTIASPYSVRPKPGATVSAPLNWDEVNNNLKITNFTIFNMRERVKQMDDPWKNLTSVKADLDKALKVYKADINA